MDMERPQKATWFQHFLVSLFSSAIIYAVGNAVFGQGWRQRWTKTLAYIGAALLVLGVSGAIIIGRLGNRRESSVVSRNGPDADL